MTEPAASPETIARDTVVTLHYDLHDAGADDALLESSRAGAPLSILYGYGNLIPGVENALLGQAPGGHVEVTVPPEQGYGPRREATRRISKKHLLRPPKRLLPGMQVSVRAEQGALPATVLKVGASVVDLDMNHPMAGRTLRFVIDILALRAADPEEIAHGHVHAR